MTPTAAPDADELARLVRVLKWPASVLVEIDGAQVDLCAECALAVSDAGLSGRGEG